MTGKTHHYELTVRWTGNTGSGTSGYKNYKRDDEITSNAAKQPILGSSDPAFRGDSSRWNPEELLVASLSACHKLWYLHLCAEAGAAVPWRVESLRAGRSLKWVILDRIIGRVCGRWPFHL